METKAATWRELVEKYGNDRRVRKAIRAGEWINVFPGIYLPPQDKDDWFARLDAALRWAEGAVFSHQTAAVLHELDFRSSEIHLTVPRKSALRSVTGITLHRSKIPPFASKKRRGYPCTSVARTLFDLAAVAAFIDLAIAVEASWRKSAKVVESLQRAFARGRFRGRPGADRLRMIIEDCTRRGKPLRSALEVRMWWLLQEAEFPLPIPGLLVRDSDGQLEIDFAYLAAMLAIETDGQEVHGPENFVKDARRQSRLVAMGWRVPRFTYYAIVFWPEEVLRQIHEALMFGQPPEGPDPFEPPPPHSPEAAFEGDPFEIPEPGEIHEGFELPATHPWNEFVVDACDHARG